MSQFGEAAFKHVRLVTFYLAAALFVCMSSVGLFSTLIPDHKHFFPQVEWVQKSDGKQSSFLFLQVS